MFPAPFDYRRPQSIDEALAILAQHGDDARVLAGGQSLIPAMRFRLARPAVLVDINAIPNLDYVRETDGVIAVGAIARDAAIERSETIASMFPLIADASRVVADPVVRQTGTVIGSLCHNDPAGDWPVVALAMNAQIVVRGKGGTRSISSDDFIVDSYTTAVGEGEMAVEVRFPKPQPRTSGAYKKLERKIGDFATASAAANITLAGDGTIAHAGIAVGAVGPKALRVAAAEKLLTGAKPTRELIDAAGREAEKIADPTADNRGSVAYKKAMADVLVRRAILEALERLGVGDLK